MLRKIIPKHSNKFIHSSILKYSSFNNDGNITIKKCGGGKQIVSELGQPTYWTHPHLFHTPNPSEFNKQVTPGITRQEFEQRRFNYVTNLTNYQMLYFSTKLSSSEKTKYSSMPLNQWIQNGFDINTIDHNFIAVIPSSMTTYMAPDVPYPFRQNSDFMYLTGFNEPDSVLVISRTGDDRNSFKTAIFVKEKNPKKELWDGPCTGPENIKNLCGIEYAYPISDFKNYLDSLVKESNPNKKISLWRYPTENVVKHESGPNVFNEKIESSLENFIEECKSNRLIDMNEQESVDGSAAASYFNTSRYFVQICRVVKSKAELNLMKKACDISSEAFINSMKISHPFINESLIYSKFDFDCKIRGSEYLGYIPVIAGGNRATTLHYIRNNQIIKNGELVLMDAGCQYNEYVSDITRAWPVSGKFSREQRELYQACLNVQKHCISNCAPGISIQKLYFIMMRKLADELSQIGIIDRKEYEGYAKQDDLETSPLPFNYMKKLTNFCAHDVGHYLGLDVHDCPEVSKQNDLEPNTAITIEPGIYIRHDDESVPARYRGIGIRIEDDIVITDNGYQILSDKCPKEIDDLEKLLNSK
ncbi:unnamed protein product [Brachionus calyciflorus]|uniref:Aminopeptidase P N-terminal domain-containing protein n=1 Tax=Brachionus calyciflorus TaxID=104777 RepID=A0A813XBA1_9BILA|nr:unnamed protein product [Brachionus calyciflorus]